MSGPRANQDVREKKRALSGRQFLYRRSAVYVAAFLGTVVTLSLWLRPWESAWTGAFPEANDLVHFQASVLAHGQSGVFGTESHLAWPSGYALWSYPVHGLLIATQAWISVGVFGLPSALASVLIWMFLAGLGSLTALYLYRSFLGSSHSWLACGFAVAVSTSAFVLTRVMQPIVAAFFLVPLVLAVIARYRFMDSTEKRVTLFVVGIASLASSLWWVIVCLLMLPFFAMIEGLRRRRCEVFASLFTFLCVLSGFLIQAGLGLMFQAQAAVPNRSPWDSVEYGGHLLDLAVASPAVTSVVPQIWILSPGLSVGVSQVGIFLMLGGIVALLLVLYGLPRNFRVNNQSDSGVLADAGIVSLLFFLAGGLGIVQAAIAIAVGSESPARVWSRLILVFCFVGSAYILIIIACVLDSRFPVGRVRTLASTLIASMLLASVYLDARVIKPAYPEVSAELPEGPALGFLVSKTAPCPVAQLPQEGQPMVRVPTPSTDPGRYYYRGFLPYLLEPTYSWSFGSWTQDPKGGLSSVGTSLGREDLDNLKRAGFCAVMYDRKLAEAARLAFTQIEGMLIEEYLKPSFIDDEYAVWIL